MSTASVTSAYMRTSGAYHTWIAEQAMSAVASSDPMLANADNKRSARTEGPKSNQTCSSR